MPDIYHRTIGATVRGFSFLFPNASKTLKDNFISSNNVLNIANGTEETANVLTSADIFPEEKKIKEKIAKYNGIPIKQLINESSFLYDKSNLIKETCITPLNKKISIYGSFSYFQGKTPKEILTLLSAGNFLEFFVENNTLKNELKFQLTTTSGNTPKIKDVSIMFP